MMKNLFLVLMVLTPLARATEYTVNPSQSTAAIQSVIAGAAPRDTVSFSAGTYSINAAITLRCGVTYTGPSVSHFANPTAILNATFPRGSAAIFNLYPRSGFAAPCNAKTTIQNLWFQNTQGIYIQTSFSNITITNNKFTNLWCCTTSGVSTAAINFDSSKGNNATQVLTNAAVTWNLIGDSTSCLTPETTSDNSYGTVPLMHAYTKDLAGGCAGIIVQTTVHGMVISNNKFDHLGEGVHILCYGDDCQPPTGPITYDLTAKFNDFSRIHRIAWEEQPEATQNILFDSNSEHDPFHPFFGNFDLSFACCAPPSGPVYSSPVVTNNVLIQNVATGLLDKSYIGYGIEAWGKGAQYNNNLVQGLNNSIGIAWGYGGPWTINYNNVCGPNFSGANNGGTNYIGAEGAWNQTVPTQIGNTTSATCSAKTSKPPTISPPPAGTYSAPILVTLTDDGYANDKGAVGPVGNTSIYYTTDGTTPTTSSALYTAPFPVAPGTTVKAIGMWGSGANPKSYPPGYGFVPSAVQSAHYAGSTPGNSR